MRLIWVQVPALPSAVTNTAITRVIWRWNKITQEGANKNGILSSTSTLLRHWYCTRLVSFLSLLFLKCKWLIPELPPRYYSIFMDWKILKLEDPFLNLYNVYFFFSQNSLLWHRVHMKPVFYVCVLISSGKEKLSIKIHCWRDIWLVIPSQRWCESFFSKAEVHHLYSVTFKSLTTISQITPISSVSDV